MIESNNGHALLATRDARPRYNGELLLRTRPKTYRKAAQLLADPNCSVLQISKSLRLSEHTVRAIRAREAQDIADRKKSLAAMLAYVAELGAARMEETIGKATLRDAAIGTGIAVDKMLALTGQAPMLAVQVNVPTAEERAKLDEVDAKLDAVWRKLNA